MACVVCDHKLHEFGPVQLWHLWAPIMCPKVHLIVVTGEGRRLRLPWPLVEGRTHSGRKADSRDALSLSVERLEFGPPLMNDTTGW